MKRNYTSFSLIIIGFVFVACTPKDSEYRNNMFFQYYISTIRIQNPRVVLFYERDGSYIDYPMHGFVCPDSAIKYCADRNWKDREDVFLLNGRWFHEEQSLFKADGKRFFKIKPWDEGHPWFDPEPFNDTIHVAHFFFEDDITFILSMQSTAYWEWDSQDPEEGDLIDTAKYANTYRLAVRPKYSIWQNKKIEKLKKELRVCYEVIELTDTTLFVPVKCEEDED